MRATGLAMARWAVVLLVAALAAPGVARVRAEDAEPEAPAAPKDPLEPADDEEEVPPTLDARIKVAVERGVTWLRNRPDASGSWGKVYAQGVLNYAGGKDVYQTPYGPTALALYTLLKCGVPPGERVVVRGFEFLRKPSKVAGDSYEVSMKLLAVTATADPFKKRRDSAAAAGKLRLTGEMRSWATSLTEALVAQRAPHGWRYWGKQDVGRAGGGAQDLSSTQLAALALFSAERCGVRVAPDVWVGILRYTLDQQEEKGPSCPRAVVSRPTAPSKPGTTAAPVPEQARDRARGFAYIRVGGPAPHDCAASGGMTACGVASLMMARFALMTRTPKVWERQDASAVQAGVYDGLAWLDANWDPITNPPKGESQWHLYYQYCVERAMDLVGGWRLGKRLWYVEMAEQLLPLQRADGSWNHQARGMVGGDVVDTCFALLFLHRATRGGIPMPSVTGGAEDPAVDNR